MAAPTFPLVRRERVKTNNDVQVWLNAEPGVVIRRHLHDGTIVRSWDVFSPRNGSTPSAGAGSWTATYVNSANIGPIGDFTAYPPLYYATVGAVLPAAPLDMLVEVELPDANSDQLIGYDQGIQAQPELSFKAIPWKFNNADHYVPQRAGGTLNMSFQMVGNRDINAANLSFAGRWAGRPITIITKVIPDDVGVPEELHYYCNAIINPASVTTGAEGNAEVVIQYSATYGFYCFFSAPATP